MTPRLHTWQRIVHELERAGGYARRGAVMAAAGYPAKDGGIESALSSATMGDVRLYETVGLDGRVWLGLDDA